MLTAEARKAGIATDAANRERDDFYPTPPFAVEELCAREKFVGGIWESACGDGAIAKVLIHHGYELYCSDLVDRGYGSSGVDFLMEWQPRMGFPNIVTNPPYKYACEFARKALELASGKVAMLCRLQFLESKERRKLFEQYKPARVWVFSERLSMQRGRQATAEDSTGMVAFCWIVWDKVYKGPCILGWI